MADKPIMKKKPRKKKSKMYFGQPTQDAIIEYLATDSQREKNKIYRERIAYPFSKLAENIIHTFKFYYFDVDSESVKQEVVSFMVMNMDKFDASKGKAFSYFSVVAKNWLILNNNRNYKMYKIHTTTDATEYKNKMITGANSEERSEEIQDFFGQLIEYWENNITKVFRRQKDITVADSVLYLMKQNENIENFNKKALYILIREMTGSKTQHITRVINVMKKKYLELYREFNLHGDILDSIEGNRLF